jgi:hypothetical protein
MYVCVNLCSGEWPLHASIYWDQGWGAGVLSAVTSDAARAFYDDLFRRLLEDGMSSFTQDFLDFQGLLFPTFLADAAGNGAWGGGGGAPTWERITAEF